MATHIEWLMDELPGLERAGVLDADAAGRVRTHYAAVPGGRGHRAALVLSLLGALLLGGGLILLIAHNWEALPRAARLATALLPLLAAQALAWPAIAGRMRGRDSYVEAVGGFWALATGAAIALVGQIYHIPGETEAFLAAWGLGVLPIVYLLDSSFAGLIALGIAAGWAGYMAEEGRQAALFWVGLLPLLPWLRAKARQVATSMRAAWALWGAALAVIVGLGCSLDRGLPGLWIVAYSGLFAAAIGLDTLRAPGVESWARRPFAAAGGLGMIVLALLFTYAWPWREIGWQHYRYDRSTLGAVVDALVTLAWCGAGLFFAVRAAMRGDGLRAAYLTFPLLAALAYLIESQYGHGVLPAVLFNVWLFAIGLATALTGARSGRLTLLNGGLLAVCGVVVARFFDSDMEVLARSLAFIVLGAALLGSNLYVMRRKGGRS